jgi:Rrf2 family protein
MLLPRSCQYAIRALVHMATHEPDRRCLAHEIAESEQIPAPFLATVLQDLARGGVVSSYRGPTGGFALARPADQITLHEVLDVSGALRGLAQCAIGLETCSGDTACPLHDRWAPLRQRLVDYYRSVTVADMAAALRRKKARPGRRRTGARAARAARGAAGGARR